MSMLEVKDLQVYYGVIQAFKQINYIVEQGDKLTDISRKVYGTEDMVSQICQKNNIENGDHICAGDKLLLP